ncbi:MULTISPECIES: CoA ester lyase [unclassified Beijerinckia]|uniref:HpcH/HpaI aldolase/citrate lyase family protein n=1 Tax=unclassified Beijerinckia TaxID=2638183 RepID=UPI00089B9AEA|nr:MULTISPECIES: CoA ester lyase [unclassified Beijerinckia]MDH7798426.1 citrate lyase subunit beta/citryl-CoA lyase [Beijerinckia sp. GAS462]SED20473.1 citrate lyase subunit beta / citryl-CoA lyase [Beijerinckia sp. 28-YEA-48]
MTAVQNAAPPSAPPAQAASALPRPRRSTLYIPGSNTRAMEKARDLPADALILDLEDAVAPSQKDAARRQIRAALESKAYGRREIIVRINALDTPFAQDDLAAIAQISPGAGPDAILVPKILAPGQVVRAGHALTQAGAPEATRLWIMIETPLAVLDIRNIAATAVDPSVRLAAFVLGLNDLAKETGAQLTPNRDHLQPVLLQCLLAARAYGLAILDSVRNDFSDADGLRGECAAARALGFDGKTLIHPNQIAIANEIFAPSAAEITEASAIVAAFAAPEAANLGAVSVNGRMVERLHAEIATRTLALAGAIAQLRP